MKQNEKKSIQCLCCVCVCLFFLNEKKISRKSGEIKFPSLFSLKFTFENFLFLFLYVFGFKLFFGFFLLLFCSRNLSTKRKIQSKLIKVNIELVVFIAFYDLFACLLAPDIRLMFVWFFFDLFLKKKM